MDANQQQAAAVHYAFQDPAYLNDMIGRVAKFMDLKPFPPPPVVVAKSKDELRSYFGGEPNIGAAYLQIPHDEILVMPDVSPNLLGHELLHHLQNMNHVPRDEWENQARYLQRHWFWLYPQ